MSALPYSPLDRAGEWACISGQIGLDEQGLVEGFEGQLRQIFANLGRLLDEHKVLISHATVTLPYLDVDLFDQLRGT